MKDVTVDGVVHRLVAVSVKEKGSCQQCSFGTGEDCHKAVADNFDCFGSTGDPERPSFAYKIVEA